MRYAGLETCLCPIEAGLEWTFRLDSGVMEEAPSKTIHHNLAVNQKAVVPV